MSTNEQDFESLIRSNKDRMIRTIWRIVRDPEDAKDALQEALSSIWKRFRKVRDHANPRALMLRICINASYDVMRRRARRTRDLDVEAVIEYAPDTAGSITDRLAGEEQQETIFKAIHQLSTHQAEAVLMRVLHGESYAMIGQALGCSEATARTHVKRARSRLAQLLSDLAPHLNQEVPR